MELKKVTLHALLVVLMIGFISCQDEATGAPDGDATESPAEPAAVTGEADAAPAQAAPAGDEDPCGPVGANGQLCLEKLGEEVTCEKLKEFETCMEGSYEGCSDETTIAEVKEAAAATKAEKGKDLGCEETAPEAPADEKPEVTEAQMTTIPTTTEPPLPKCDDPIAKAAEVQKCNDRIEQDSLCIQIQKAVDCVEERADCSEENFDQEIDKYLDSFENFSMDNGCIITYRNRRLEHRKRPAQAAQSQAQSGASYISFSLFSSLAVIFTGFILSR